MSEMEKFLDAFCYSEYKKSYSEVLGHSYFGHMATDVIFLKNNLPQLVKISQKEMQEKLDAAIEVIKFYGYEEEYESRGKRARDFLKARGGIMPDKIPEYKFIKPAITWYRASDKMPEAGDDIVVVTEYEVFRSNVSNALEVYLERYGDVKIWSDYHWAYASEFNFPKDEK